MLILTRRVSEAIVIDDDITITVLGVKGYQTRLGIQAPKHVPVYREEIYQRIQQEKQTPTKPALASTASNAGPDEKATNETKGKRDREPRT